MNFKKLLLSAILASASVFGASSASASCYVYGSLEQVYTNGTTTYAYVKSTNSWAVPTYVWYFSTTDANEASAIQAALHHNVRVGGSATSCPTSGIYRYGGDVQNVAAN